MVSCKAEDEFIENFGLFMESHSIFPRIAGRIYGYLLISDPPHQSAKDLVDRLLITKSSVSSMMRLLLQSKLVEEINLPGKRPRYYRIKERGWENIFLENLQALSAVRALLGEGRSLLDNREAEMLDRIEELDELYAFFEKEMPPLIERWKKSRKDEVKR